MFFIKNSVFGFPCGLAISAANDFFISSPVKVSFFPERFALIGQTNWGKEIEKSAYAPLAHNSAETNSRYSYTHLHTRKKVGQSVRLPPLPQVDTSISVCCYLPIWEESAWANRLAKRDVKPFFPADWMALNQEALWGPFPHVSSCYAFLSKLFLFSRSGFFSFLELPDARHFSCYEDFTPEPISGWPNYLTLPFPFESRGFCLWLPKPLWIQLPQFSNAHRV